MQWVTSRHCFTLIVHEPTLFWSHTNRKENIIKNVASNCRGFTVTLLCSSGTHLTHKHTVWNVGLTADRRSTCLNEIWLCSVRAWKETPTGILWICILSMCDFPWMLSFICQWRSRLEQRVKGLGLRGCGIFNFSCSVLFYDLEEAERVCWGGFFFFFSFLWSALKVRAPLSPGS